MNDYIEIVDDLDTPIRVNKGNFHFINDNDKQLYIECLEAERSINTNPSVSKSKFRNAFERFAVVTEGNRRILAEPDKYFNLSKVYSIVQKEVQNHSLTYIYNGKEYPVTGKKLFWDTLEQLRNKDIHKFNRMFDRICLTANELYEQNTKFIRIKEKKDLRNFSWEIYGILSSSSHSTVGDRNEALCIAKIFFEVLRLYFDRTELMFNEGSIPYDDYYPVKKEYLNNWGINDSRIYIKEESRGVKYYIFKSINSIEKNELEKRNYEIINTLFEGFKTENVFVANNEIGVAEARMQVISVPSRPVSLRSIISKLQDNEKRDVLLQILKTIKMMHETRPVIVHRTLCPYDFIVCRNKNGASVFLYNFATAKNMDSTTEYTVIGKISEEKVYRLKFTAPEVIENRCEDKWADRADIYSLGKIIDYIFEGEDKELLIGTVSRMCCEQYEKRPSINEVLKEITDLLTVTHKCNYAIKTSKSPKRKQQDAFFVDCCEEYQADDCNISGTTGRDIICAVFDGIGGGRAGNEVSKLCAEKTKIFWETSIKSNYSTILTRYIAELQKEVVEFMDSECYDYAGTTVAIAVIEGDRISIANVGDSKVYLVNKDGMEQLTQDHRFTKGIVKQKELYQYIGMDEFDGKIVPYVNEFEKKEGDYILLCSDGLSDYVSLEQIKSIVMSDIIAKDKTNELIDLARKNGSQDDITIIVVKGE